MGLHKPRYKAVCDRCGKLEETESADEMTARRNIINHKHWLELDFRGYYVGVRVAMTKMLCPDCESDLHKFMSQKQ